MANKFELFLEQLNIKDKPYFKNVILEEVQVDPDTKSWVFHVRFERVLEVKHLETFIEKISSAFKMAGKVDKIDCLVSYQDPDLSLVNTEAYFSFILKKIASKKPRFNVFNDFKVLYESNKFVLSVDPESLHLKRYCPEIKRQFLQYGLDVDVELRACEEVVKTSDLKEKKELESIKHMEKLQKEVKANLGEPDKQPVKLGRYNHTKDIKEPAVPIKEIPNTQESLDLYKNKNGVPLFVISGEIFSIEIKKLTNFSLAEIKMTDYEDSIIVKRFMRKDDEIQALSILNAGDWIKVSGKADYDTYTKDVVIMADKLNSIEKPKKKERHDVALNKRVELHLHTKMSAMDAVTDASDYLKQAEAWGHKAIAFTDHSGVYAYPEIAKASKGKKIKPIYGLEVDFVDEAKFRIALTDHERDLKKATFVVFDIETTGLSIEADSIIEIAAVKVEPTGITQTYQSFVNPNRPIGKISTDITGITDDMVKDAPQIKTVLEAFLAFAEGSILVAHNATFDMGHLYQNLREQGLYKDDFLVIDTLQMARAFYSGQLKRYNLNALAKFFKVRLDQHHRALDDAKATAEIFMYMLADLYKQDITEYHKINQAISETDIWKHAYPTHVNILVKNQKGYKNLFMLLSDALTDHFHGGARVLKSVLNQYREGLLVGSGCANGEVFETALNRTYEELLEKVEYYDYIEVQPPSIYAHLFADESEIPLKLAQDIIEKIIKAAQAKNKLIVATGDVHHLHPEDKVYREIYVRVPSVGGGLHDLARYETIPSQHLMTTDEMLVAFNFLDKDLAYEIVVTNTNLIAEGIDTIQAFSKTLYSPEDHVFKDKLGVPSIVEALKTMVNSRAHELYGNPLPEMVKKRLDKELNSIINNNFSGVYYISHLLVKKSLDDGYLVGSRGSVGSSLVATLMDITEVNPLSPHYRCPNCQFTSFKMNEEEKSHYTLITDEKALQPILDTVESGYDLPKMDCPRCQSVLVKDGHDIPFETFLGFSGDKVPDIDLNFSGDYQSKAHAYVRDLLGSNNTFRSGTIQTVAERNAFGYVKGYLEDQNKTLRNVEIERLAKKIEGVRRSSGQHPGGIIVVPDTVSIYDITPIQYPADDVSSDWKTTHFDYHSFEDNLLKLDILGHDDPTVIKFLMDYVNEHQNEFPFDHPRDIPLDDPQVYELFRGTEIINVSVEDIKSEVASYAIPEFGTGFTRQMLRDTKPKTFAELVKISGLSHGTDVWLKNAQDLVLGKRADFGTIKFSDVIGCRDDIMVYLMYQGLEPIRAFEIMEFVRRGKPSKDKDKWKEYEAEMQNHRVPSWYIWSCEQIKYMFPKAHATAYVLMAVRIAWFKIHKPILFYSAYFSIRAEQFDAEIMTLGYNAIRNKIADIEATFNPTKKEEDLMTCLLVAQEMTRRGMKFLKVDIEQSEARTFKIEGNALRLPFVAIDGLGMSVAEDIVSQREISPFISKKDAMTRTKINKTILEKLDQLGAFDHLDEEEAETEHGLFALEL